MVAACLTAVGAGQTIMLPDASLSVPVQVAGLTVMAFMQVPMRTQPWLAGLLALACLTAGALAQTDTAPDTSLFAPVQIAGDLSTGFPAYYYGCTDNGATLQDIIVYANDNFLRGMEVHFLKSCLMGIILPLADAKKLSQGAQYTSRCPGICYDNPVGLLKTRFGLSSFT